MDRDDVIKARRQEMKSFRKMGVLRKVPKSWATGKTIKSTRWVDTNKGGSMIWDVRCRLVGRDFKGGDKGRDDLFAETPPLEAKTEKKGLFGFGKKKEA